MTDDLLSIPGVGETLADHLRDAGFETADDVRGATVEELTEAERVGKQTAEALINEDTDGYNGRPTKLDDERYEAIMDAAERGLTYEGIARTAGIGLATLDDWRDQYEDFSKDLEQHRAVGELKLVDRVSEDKPEFILERSYDYIKTEKREIEGEHEHRVEGDGFVVEFGDGE